jgi:hypothetical protein
MNITMPAQIRNSGLNTLNWKTIGNINKAAIINNCKFTSLPDRVPHLLHLTNDQREISQTLNGDIGLLHLGHFISLSIFEWFLFDDSNQRLPQTLCFLCRGLNLQAQCRCMKPANYLLCGNFLDIIPSQNRLKNCKGRVSYVFIFNL